MSWADFESFFKGKYYEAISGCLVCHTSINHDGYAHVWFKKKKQRAHRVAYRLTFGEFPQKIFICHKCDNRKCINPNHLYLGNNTTNMHDCAIRSRRAFQKLTKEDVQEIRKLHAGKIMGYGRLAKKFKVSRSTITAIIKREAWHYVD